MYLTTPKECKEALSLSNRMQSASPFTPVNSHSSSFHSETSGSRVLSEEIDSGNNHAFYTGSSTSVIGGATEYGSRLDEGLMVTDHELRLHEINTLDWADLLESSRASSFDQPRAHGFSDSRSHLSSIDHCLPHHNSSSVGNLSNRANGTTVLDAKQPNSSYLQLPDQNVQLSFLETIDTNFHRKDDDLPLMGTDETLVLEKNALQSQDSFTRWIKCITNDSPYSLDELPLERAISSHDGMDTSVMDHSPLQEQAFSITDVSPQWAMSTEETKVIVIGYFHEAHSYLAQSSLLCVFGDICVPAEMVQVGVLRCTALPQTPGVVNFYLSLDGRKPISQVLTFEYHSILASQMNNEICLPEDESKSEEFQVQIRLAHLLFSSSNIIDALSSKVASDALKEARRFRAITPSYEKDWLKLTRNKGIPFPKVNTDLFELTLKAKLHEWLLERVVEGCKTTSLDCQGQGVIHLCAMLGYAWAVYPFSCSGLSLDFRDAHGWTALHWAAHFGREQMVAFLLSAGANPSLVTDPTPKCPGGYTAADLASMQGHDGLGAYLAEKGLTAHFNAMSISGNISGSLQAAATSIKPSDILSEEEQLMRDSLAAYRTAADAAARIQIALREHALKVRTKAVQLENPETEALNIIAAMRIQHAYRNFNSRKRMAAAVRIQHKFRTWKIRKNFLNMRQQAIRIQAAFRGHLVRNQYCKILWSVGVLEKAILRWRLKRKGLRGLQAEPTEAVGTKQVQDDDVEEDFYQISRKHAEERVERAVTRVQAMFRSHQAQKEYHRMKLAFEQAKREYDELLDSVQQQ